MKKSEIPEVSVKSTKDQILAAYNDVLVKLNEKQTVSPQELKKKEEEKTVISKATSQSADAIVSDLRAIKLKSIKQIDILSEELLREFHKLSERAQILQHYQFESQLKFKEHEGLIKLNEERISSYTSKIKEQETLIRNLTQKADQATQQVQSIAYRALDTSVQRYTPAPGIIFE